MLVMLLTDSQGLACINNHFPLLTWHHNHTDYTYVGTCVENTQTLHTGSFFDHLTCMFTTVQNPQDLQTLLAIDKIILVVVIHLIIKVRYMHYSGAPLEDSYSGAHVRLVPIVPTVGMQ